MRGLELKVPPVALVVLIAGLMWLVSQTTPALTFVMTGRVFFAVSVAIVGIGTSMAGIASFRQARTTVNPMKPESSSSLVRAGIYARSRNPMYLGFLLILLAWAIALSNAVAFCLLPVFILYMNRFQIEPEERALRSLFGEDFLAYASRVRRWL